jgi:FkbM family methyltransferase
MLESMLNEVLLRPMPGPLPPQVLVYGAGGMGRRVAHVLRERGIDVPAILDRRAEPGGSADGIPMSTAEHWLARAGGCKAVAIGIHNPGHRLATVVRELGALGFGPIYTPIDLCNLYPTDFSDGFWLAPRSVYRDCAPHVEALAGVLADTRSKELLARILRFRIGGDCEAAPEPDGGQYCPQDLPPWAASLRLIDCGAYTGDSLEDFTRAGYGIEAAVCLEPDERNYAALAATVRRLGVAAMALPCAAHASAQVLRFSAEGAGSSHLGDTGGAVVQALAIDDAFAGFAPNLIKMDIEGAEPQALEGAMRTLTTHRPGLAISIYHQPEHLWTIPLMLAERLADYEFYLRAHSHNTFDVVLYARPRAPTWKTGDRK